MRTFRSACFQATDVVAPSGDHAGLRVCESRRLPKTHSRSALIPAVRSLATNAQGRDFVASDLHGCHGALMRALEAVRFDPAAGDRLMLGGDLIDRGSHSMACLRLLREPWVHACLGNHEAMLLTWLGRRDSRCHDAEDFVANGGAWAEALLESATRRDLEELSELASLVERLPLVLAVDDAVLPFNVAHTDLQRLLGPRCAAAPQQRLHRLQPLPSERADRVLWSRALAHELDDPARAGAPVRLDGDLLMVSDTPLEPGLTLTYVGHTPGPVLRLHRSRLFIDHGAVHAGRHGRGWRLALLEHRRVAALLAGLAPRGPMPGTKAGTAINKGLGAPIWVQGSERRRSSARLAA